MIDGQLRYYLGIHNPEELIDQEWAKHFKVLERIRQNEKVQQQQAIGEMFGK